MLQRVEAERIFQRIMQEYDDGVQKEVLLQELIRELNLSIQNRLQKQIETLLERKLDPMESEKVATLNFLKHHGQIRRDGSYFRITVVLLTVIVFCSVLSIVSYKTSGSVHGVDPITEAPNTDAPPTTLSKTASVVPSPPPTQVLYEIEVSEWNDIHECRDHIPVGAKIYGVVISGGQPPYLIEAYYKNGLLNQHHQFTKGNVLGPAEPLISSLSPTYRVRFESNILADLNRPITLIIKSETPTGEPKWEGDLFFPPKPLECY